MAAATNDGQHSPPAGAFTARRRRDGQWADVRLPQHLMVALCRAPLNVSDLRLMLALLFRQYQFTGDVEARQVVRVDDMAELLNISRRTVFAALARLEAAGMVTRSGRGGRARPSTYSVTEPEGWRLDTVRPAAPYQPRNSATGDTVSGVEQCDGDGIVTSRPVTTKRCRLVHETVQPAALNGEGSELGHRIPPHPPYTSTSPTTFPNTGSAAAEPSRVSGDGELIVRRWEGLTGRTATDEERALAESWTCTYSDTMDEPEIVEMVTSIYAERVRLGKPPERLAYFGRALADKHTARGGTA